MALAGKSIVLLDFPAKTKLSLSRTIQSLGGSSSYVVNRGVFAVISTAEEYERKSSKILAAEKHNILILEPTYLDALVADNNRGFVHEFKFALNSGVSALPPSLVKNPISHVHQQIRSVASRLAAIAAVVFAEADTPSVSSLDNAASSDDSEGSASESWATQVEKSKEMLNEQSLDPSIPLWKRKLLARQAELKDRQDKERAAKQEAEAARARARHVERQADQQATKEDLLRRKEDAIKAKAAAAALRKKNKKIEVFAKRDKMVADRQAVRDAEEDARKVAAEEKRQRIIDDHIAKLTEIAKKIVERELHKDEFEAKQKAYLAEIEKKRQARHADNQRKLFVGNVIVEDIIHASKKLTGERDEEKFQMLLKGRTDALLEVFKQFGKVDLVIPFWEKKHAFVLFTTEEEARKAYLHLKVYENRKKASEETRKKLQKDKKPQLMNHKANYYVRWNYNKTAKSKWGKGKKKKAEGEEEEGEAKEKNEKEERGEETEPVERIDKKEESSSKKTSKAKAKGKAKTQQQQQRQQPQPPKKISSAPASAEGDCLVDDTDTAAAGLPVEDDDGTQRKYNDIELIELPDPSAKGAVESSSLLKVNASLAVHCDRFVLFGAAHQGALHLYSTGQDLSPPTHKHTFSDSHEGLTCIDLYGSTPLVLAGYEDGNVMLWRGADDSNPTTFPVGSAVRSISFGREGLYFAAALSDLSLQVWSCEGNLIGSIDAPHGEHPFNVHFPTGGILSSCVVSLGDDGFMRVWNTEGSLRPRKDLDLRLDAPALVRCTTSSPAGCLVAVATDNVVFVIDLNTHKILFCIRAPTPITSLSFSLHRYHLLALSAKGVHVIDLESKRSVATLRVAAGGKWVSAAPERIDLAYVAVAKQIQVYEIDA